MSTPVQSQDILSHLQSKGLNPTQGWLQNFLSTQKSSIPLHAQQKTALFRLLNTDVTSSLQNSSSSVLPRDILNPEIRERVIKGPIVVQVLDIEDIGSSRWSQVEAIESEERGERTKGREIIRVVANEEGETEQNKSAGPHKLLLQDSQGGRVYGFELFDVDGISLNMNIGTKLVLRDVTVARSTILLEPKSVVVLGGKIEEMHKRWKQGRKEALKTAARGGAG